MGTATVEFEVGGMHCASCVALIEETLAAEPGVRAVSVDLDARRTTVTFDPGVLTVDDLTGAVVGAGYEVTPLASDATAS
jgi:copper chaperone CopZ